MPMIVNNWTLYYIEIGQPWRYRAINAKTGQIVDFTRAATAVRYCQAN